MAPPKRMTIETLVNQHGVQGLADRLGVHVRSVRRWRNDGVEPSPLAKEKLKEVAGGTGSTGTSTPDPAAPAPAPSPRRHPIQLPAGMPPPPPAGR